MSIEVTCPNGHTLKVKDSLAGKSGLCPQCKAPVDVPEPTVEDMMMDILSPSESGLIASAPDSDDNSDDKSGEWTRPGRMQICPKCQKEFPSDASICPECKTYVM